MRQPAPRRYLHHLTQARSGKFKGEYITRRIVQHFVRGQWLSYDELLSRFPMPRTTLRKRLASGVPLDKPLGGRRGPYTKRREPPIDKDTHSDKVYALVEAWEVDDLLADFAHRPRITAARDIP